MNIELIKIDEHGDGEIIVYPDSDIIPSFGQTFGGAPIHDKALFEEFLKEIAKEALERQTPEPESKIQASIKKMKGKSIIV